MKEHKNIEVEIIADSVNPYGKRITSALWTYPRFIHSEIMTHRQLSRNAASSRAIPVSKVMKAVTEHPAMPEWWGAAQSGMQAYERLPDTSVELCKTYWLEARNAALASTSILSDLGLAKQITNRLLEPWFRITVLVTATDWDNFFALRAHPAAQPEFQVLAYRMLDAMIRNKPATLDWDEWHMPFQDKTLDLEHQLKCSVASAARTSYVTYDSQKSLAEQVALHDHMWDSGHWSPFEHQARASSVTRSGNFSGGWLQYRQTLERNVHRDVDYEALMAAKPDWITL